MGKNKLHEMRTGVIMGSIGVTLGLYACGG